MLDINNLELSVSEIYEIASREKGLSRYPNIDVRLISEVKVAGKDFFGEITFNCSDLIEAGILTKEDIEDYVKYKLKYFQVTIDGKTV